jgi:hypothetical protein
MIPLGSSTEDNTGFAARIYAWDSGNSSWDQVAYADDYYAGTADAGTTVSVDFVNAIELRPDTAYMLVCAAKFTAGSSSIYFSTYNGYKDYENTSYLNKYASVLNLGGTWYYINSVPTMAVELGYPCNYNNLLSKNIKIYPNPTKNNLQITIGNELFIENDVFIYDIYGRTVLKQICHAERSDASVSIDVSNLQNGVYFVKVGNAVAKFVKE